MRRLTKMFLIAVLSLILPVLSNGDNDAAWAAVHLGDLLDDPADTVVSAPVSTLVPTPERTDDPVLRSKPFSPMKDAGTTIEVSEPPETAEHVRVIATDDTRANTGSTTGIVGGGLWPARKDQRASYLAAGREAEIQASNNKNAGNASNRRDDAQVADPEIVAGGDLGRDDSTQTRTALEAEAKGKTNYFSIKSIKPVIPLIIIMSALLGLASMFFFCVIAARDKNTLEDDVETEVAVPSAASPMPFTAAASEDVSDAKASPPLAPMMPYMPVASEVAPDE